jgi:hypothetical protein
MFHDRRPGREVVRKETKRNPGAFQVANRIQNFSGGGFGKGDPRDTNEFRKEELVLLPLFIVHVRIVRAPRYACVCRVLNGVRHGDVNLKISINSNGSTSDYRTSTCLYQPIVTEPTLQVGTVIPSGSYDGKDGTWKPGPNGRVVRILDIKNGLAEVDTTGDGKADSTGLSLEERKGDRSRRPPERVSGSVSRHLCSYLGCG